LGSGEGPPGSPSGPPTATAASLRVGGGVSRLSFGDQRFGAVGGGIRLQTEGFDRTADRYEIEIEGGSSCLTVTFGDTALAALENG
jgi:hypothetical protein